MSFKKGDKVVFTVKGKPKPNDYGVIVGFTTYDDNGYTNPIVRFNGDDYDSFPVAKYLTVVEKFPIKKKSKARPYLSNKEVIKRVLKSTANTVFTTPEQVENTLKILGRMGVLNTLEGRK